MSATDSHLCLLGPDAPPGDRVIGGVDLDADERTAQPLAGYARGAAAHEGIEDGAPIDGEVRDEFPMV